MKFLSKQPVFIKVITALAVLLAITYLVLMVFYLVKPVGLAGHNCTFDYYDCESNLNLIQALGNLMLALGTGVSYVLIRLIYWWARQRKR